MVKRPIHFSSRVSTLKCMPNAISIFKRYFVTFIDDHSTKRWTMCFKEFHVFCLKRDRKEVGENMELSIKRHHQKPHN